jgi:hypothetical protein
MASFTLRPTDREEFDSLLGGIVQQFPDVQVEAAHNDTWNSYRVDVSCADPAAGPLIAWLLNSHANCPRT